MNEGNKTPRKIEESSKSVVGSSSAVKPAGWKRVLSKRWVFPAAYMAAAAIIVAILWIGSGAGKEQPSVPGMTEVESERPGVEVKNPDASVPVAATGEVMQWPVSDIGEMVTAMSYYDASASVEERQAAMVEYNNMFKPHMAVDLSHKDAKSFDVLAAMSGKVIVAEQTPVNNFEVRIEHENGLVTVYQSLTDVRVHVGDEVAQGEPIAAASQSELEQHEGVHVHFEVLQGEQSVNPMSLID